MLPVSTQTTYLWKQREIINLTAGNSDFFLVESSKLCEACFPTNEQISSKSKTSCLNWRLCYIFAAERTFYWACCIIRISIYILTVSMLLFLHYTEAYLGPNLHWVHASWADQIAVRYICIKKSIQIQEEEMDWNLGLRCLLPNVERCKFNISLQGAYLMCSPPKWSTEISCLQEQLELFQPRWPYIIK